MSKSDKKWGEEEVSYYILQFVSKIHSHLSMVIIITRQVALSLGTRLFAWSDNVIKWLLCMHVVASQNKCFF